MSSARRGDEDDWFGRLFHHVSAGIAVAAVDGRFLDVNPAFCEILGYTAEELRAMDFISLTHPDDRTRNLRLIEELLTGERDRFSIEKRYLTRENGTVWVRASISLLRDEGGEPRLVATTEDISAQKAAETRLEESQALLRIAGEVGQVGGWAIDTDPVKLYWSDEVHDLAGYPRGQTPPLEEALGLYPPDERERMTAAVEACIADAVPFDIECAFVPAHGDPRWVRVVGEPRWATDGTVDRIQGAIIDISQQKRAQQEGERLAARLRTTMESITDALYTIDTDWRFTYLNARAQEILERSADELIGRSIWEVFPSTVGSPLQEAFQRAAAENCTVVLEEYYDEPLDRYHGVNVYPSEQGLAVYFRDVTARRATRVELEERGVRLAQQAALLDEAQDAIVVRDLEGRISYWNRSAERIYGWTAEEAIGAQIQTLLGLDPALYAEASEQLLARGNWVHEVSKTSKDGEQLVMQARWTLVCDEERPPAVLCIDTDITERKAFEQQFLRSQRMESIGKLAGGIAHDLNNALAPIAMSIELLRSGETDPMKLRMLDIIGTSAQHGAEMVSQVLSFARGVDGRRESISLGHIIEEVRRISADTFPKSITIEADVASGLWPVVGDPTQLQQVLINLCVNARDAMPDGGTLTLSACNTGRSFADALHVGEQPHVVLRVTDTGVGITDEVREKIFDPFFSTKPRGEGTGLGLSTSAVIVESHGGRLAMSSEVGTGTTFEVYLPAAPASVGASDEEGVEPRRGAGELVLLVDDEEAIREIGSSTLESFGYRVVVAADGKQAVEAFAAHRGETALVITDVMMPAMDGYTAMDAFVRMSEDVPIIATSGLSTSEASERSLAAGARSFLAKPYDAKTLLRVVDETLRGPAQAGDAT